MIFIFCIEDDYHVILLPVNLPIFFVSFQFAVLEWGEELTQVGPKDWEWLRSGNTTGGPVFMIFSEVPAKFKVNKKIHFSHVHTRDCCHFDLNKSSGQFRTS